MIKPDQLTTLFQSPHVATWGARCPVYGQCSLRIYNNHGQTQIRCINRCNHEKILARVGLSPRNLRPEISDLVNGLTPSPAAKTQSAVISTTEPLNAQETS